MSNAEVLFPKANQNQSMVEVASSRATQEVQAAMVIAKKYPRDQQAAYTRIMQACQRKALAEQAAYVYPRGGQEVTGPSIRLAESLAQNWGNIEFGIVELEQKFGESTVMAFAWDLETNTRQTKIFQVPHIRYSKNKGNTELSDPRDIYELVANNGARRLRACILGVVPGDIVEAALEQCEKTMKDGTKEPIGDRIRKMLAAFADMGINRDMIELKLGHKADSIGETELVRLKKIYVSIRDGYAKREEFFTPVAKANPGGLQDDPELAESGLAPMPEPDTKPAAPVNPKTPHQLLGDRLEAAGVSIERFNSWAVQAGILRAEVANWDDIDAKALKVCEKGFDAMVKDILGGAK